MNSTLPPIQAVDIDQASEGMQLARDVHDANGALLLPKGARLSAASLASLRRRGIASLVVAPEAPAGATPSAPDAPDPAARQAERAQRQRRLRYLFRHSGGAGPLLLERLLQYREQVS